MHDDELAILQSTVETSSLRESLQLGAGEATDALIDLINRIEQLIHPQSPPPVEESPQETNPFSALFSLVKEGFYWLSVQSAPRSSPCGFDLRPDTAMESVARSLAILQAARHAQDLSHTLKTAT